MRRWGVAIGWVGGRGVGARMRGMGGVRGCGGGEVDRGKGVDH